jgi:hypothetical protein
LAAARPLAATLTTALSAARPLDTTLITLATALSAARPLTTLATLAATLTTLATAALAAAAFATLAASLAGLFGGELVGCPLLMRSAATLAGDLALLLLVHPGEAALVLAFVSLAHDSTLSLLGAVLQHPCSGTV